jgi:hypothetical protein
MQVCNIGVNMSLPPSPGSLRALYEKCNYLRARSFALRREARELCTVSHSLRETNAMIAGDLRLIKASGFFIPSEDISEEARKSAPDHHAERRLRG